MDSQDHDRRALHGLAEAAAAGDSRAFEALHARLNPWLIRMFQSRSEQWGLSASSAAEVAEDLSQRTWAALWKSLGESRYDPARAAITTFVYAIAHHIWLQHGRTERRRPPVASLNGATDDGQDWLPQARVDPAAELDLAANIDTVRRLLRGEAGSEGSREPFVSSALTAEDRSVLIGVGRGESDRALAVRLGVSPSTAHARKRAALEALRRAMGGIRTPPGNSDPRSPGSPSAQAPGAKN